MAGVLLEGDSPSGGGSAARVVGDEDSVADAVGDLLVLAEDGGEALALLDFPFLVQFLAGRVGVLLAGVLGVSGGVPCGKEGAEGEDGEDYECRELHLWVDG